jgi:two-component system, NarL family, invasion response regulator UvrY
MTETKKVTMETHAGSIVLGEKTSLPKNTQVLLADDSSIMRSTISYFLERAGFTIVGEASSGEEAVMLSAKLRPHVVIMDINMPGMGGIKATARLHMLMPEVKVIGFSLTDDKSTIERIMAAGAICVVSKTHITKLALAVCTACKHGKICSDRIEMPYD